MSLDIVLNWYFIIYYTVSLFLHQKFKSFDSQVDYCLNLSIWNSICILELTVWMTEYYFPDTKKIIFHRAMNDQSQLVFTFDLVNVCLINKFSLYLVEYFHILIRIIMIISNIFKKHTTKVFIDCSILWLNFHKSHDFAFSTSSVISGTAWKSQKITVMLNLLKINKIFQKQYTYRDMELPTAADMNPAPKNWVPNTIFTSGILINI